MIICSRCGYRMDNTELKECPLCYTPLPTADAVQQPGTPLGAATLPMQPQSGIPGAPPVASSGIPGVPPAGGYMPPAQTSGDPLLPPGARRSLTGEMYEVNLPSIPPPSYVDGAGGLPPRPGAMPAPRPGGPSAPRTGPILYRRETAAPSRSGGTGTAITIVLVLLLLGGGGFGGYWYWTHRSTPENQAQRYVDALKSMDYRTMYELSDSAQHNNLSEAEFEQRMKSIFNLLPGLTDSMKSINYTVGEPTVDGDTATVNVTMSGNLSMSFLGQTVSQPINQTFPLTLKNVDGMWKVSGDANAFNSGGFGSGGGRSRGRRFGL